MLETMILWVVFGILLGFVCFLFLYVFVAKAHRTPFGRSFLAFMASLGVIFGYSLFAPMIMHNRPHILMGWFLLLLLILGVVWWQVWNLSVRLKKRGTKDEILR